MLVLHQLYEGPSHPVWSKSDTEPARKHIFRQFWRTSRLPASPKYTGRSRARPIATLSLKTTENKSHSPFCFSTKNCIQSKVRERDRFEEKWASREWSVVIHCSNISLDINLLWYFNWLKETSTDIFVGALQIPLHVSSMRLTGTYMLPESTCWPGRLLQQFF